MPALHIHPATLRALLGALRGGPTLAELRAATGRSRASVFRDLGALRALGMRIQVGAGGRYAVADWGVFDPAQVAAPVTNRTQTITTGYKPRAVGQG